MTDDKKPENPKPKADPKVIPLRESYQPIKKSYQPAQGNLNPTKPPQGGSGVPPKPPVDNGKEKK